MEKIGRRLMMVISLVVGGVALLANAVVYLTAHSHVTFAFFFNLVNDCRLPCSQAHLIVTVINPPSSSLVYIEVIVKYYYPLKKKNVFPLLF